MKHDLPTRTMRIPGPLLDRAQRLLPELPTEFFQHLQPTATAVLRVALGRGLAMLEAENPAHVLSDHEQEMVKQALKEAVG